MIGNRCGHNPAALRACDVVRRGKGGHPQLLGVISAYLKRAAMKRGERTALTALDDLNPSGRRKRTEQYEVVLAVCGFLTAHWFQPDTRRCAMPNLQYLEVPDANHIANGISKSPEWAGKGELSLARVYAALGNLEQAGYIQKSKQIREQLPTGEWIARPRLIAFTKKFFLDLGGARLWRSVWAKGKRLIGELRDYLIESGQGDQAKKILAQYLNPGRLFSSRQAFAWNKANGRPPTPHLSIRLLFEMRRNKVDLPEPAISLA